MQFKLGRTYMSNIIDMIKNKLKGSTTMPPESGEAKHVHDKNCGHEKEHVHDENCGHDHKKE